MIEHGKIALEDEMRRIVARITPAVAEILASGKGGKLQLDFSAAGFQSGKKEVAI